MKEFLKKRNKCPLCNSKKRDKIIDSNISNIDSADFKITDSQYGKHWSFYKCKNCDFVYSDPSPSENFLNNLYSSVKDPEYEEENEGRTNNFKRIIKRITKLKPQKGSVLDVGAATGMFVNLLTQSGFEAEGLEPSKWAVKLAKKKYNINLIQKDFKNFKSNNKYDIITLIDILEHVSNPDNILKNAKKIMKEDGLIVIVTPDIGSILPKILKSNWWHYRPPHINFFTKKSLKYILKKNGFEILLNKPYHWKFSLKYLVSRFNLGKKIIKKSKLFRKILEFIKIKLFLFDSREIYAKRKNN